MKKLSIESLDLEGKKVLVRVDFNVPLKDGNVENDKRLRATLPTIQLLQKKGAKIILVSHLGRPKGVTEALRLAPVGNKLASLLKHEVKIAKDCIGPDAENLSSSLKNGEVLLLENVRFHPEEEANDPAFAKKLASLADVYVNDAFGTAHRAHASTEGVTKFISTSAAGLLLKKELDYLGSSLTNPKRPFVAIIGGSKISGKIDVIEALLPRVDTLLIGGGMAYTFYKAQGKEIGKSLVENDKVELAKALLQKGGEKILLPLDCMVTHDFDFGARKVGALTSVKADQIPPDQMGLDIGPESIVLFKEKILGSGTVLWNGPLGVFEIDSTAKGTFEIANALAEATKKGAITIIGGGDSAAAIEKADLEDKVSHVSTGGGASLEFLEGKVLPGVSALNDD